MPARGCARPVLTRLRDASYVTEADLSSQAAIVAALHAAFPGLRIVGEEDGAVPAPAAPAAPAAGTPAPAPALAGLADEASEVPLAEVTVLVDPVDGTRELVEGRLGAVQVLVGVAVRGRAVAGAVGLPFPDGSTEAPPALVYGLVGRGFGRIVEGREVAGPPGGAAGSSPLLYTTGDSQNAALAAAKAVLAGAASGGEVAWTKMGGAGNKLLAVAEGRVEAALMHFGTSLWDTCAPEAVVAAMGGQVSDLFGGESMQPRAGAGG